MFRDLDIWLNHFEYHAQHPRSVPAQLPDTLKGTEQRLISRSLATFQLGEHSDGHALLVSAWRFAKRHDAAPIIRIMEFFIREQQRHAALLRAFMEDHGVRMKQTDWTDFVFCCLRRCGGFEFRLHMLITAELIASIYYRALETATGCQRLKFLCRILVADELAHVGFESQLVLALHARKSPLARGMTQLLHKMFFAGAAAVVYLTHRAVLRAAGYHLGSFLKACRMQYAFYLKPPVLKSALRTP